MQFLQKIGLLASVFVFLAAPVVADTPSDSALGPTASFTASPTSVAVGRAVKFNARASRDARGGTNLNYRWDFADTHGFTAWGRTATTQHTFTDAGRRSIRLQVRDRDGFIDETKVFVRVKNGSSFKPITRIFVNQTEGDTATTFHFTVQPVSQINTPSARLEVRWDWNHDGTWDTGWSLARDFYHSFEETGYREVWLETRDTDGLTSIEKGFYVTGKENDDARTKEVGRILIEKSDRPRASFRTWPTEIFVGTNVHFDATDSLRAAQVRWDFDGDGTFDTGFFTTKKIQHSYERVGTFSATLEVKNTTGDTDRTTRTIVVSDPNNILPEAKLTVRNTTNSFAGNGTGTLFDEFSFSASASRDRDGADSKLRFRWDFDGDGEWDTTFATAKTAKHRFERIGTFRSQVEVLDERGGLVIAEVTVRIVGNSAPRAALKISPLLGTRETKFRFDAGASLDDQSGTRNLEYRFDFDGDGRFDTLFARKRVERFTPAQVGKYTAIVEVRDSANAITRATASFEIVDPTAPIAAFELTPTNVGTFTTTFKFDASATLDPSGVGGRLRYRWDFDFRSRDDIQFDTGWSTRSTTSHRYKTVGEHLVCLAVKNDAGYESKFCRSLEIHTASPYLAHLRSKGILSQEDPERLITRAELAKMVVKAAKLRTRYLREQIFTDVETKTWYAPFVAAVTERGWISPKTNFAFQPNGSVNRAEAVKIVVSALYPRVVTSRSSSPLADVPTGVWFSRFAFVAYEEGLLNTADGKFHPASAVTRGEVAEMISRLLQKYESYLAISIEPRSFFGALLRSRISLQLFLK